MAVYYADKSSCLSGRCGAKLNLGGQCIFSDHVNMVRSRSNTLMGPGRVIWSKEHMGFMTHNIEFKIPEHRSAYHGSTCSCNSE